ncbi:MULTISPECIES: LLM class flavin-dependent oxidoreductase [Frankia]|uniref:FMN-dependent alkanal monooxygenase n=1 Tax=Frankia alni (strain DSM 45986 / CECT 9034 / ACN14a) TaxID=326424 RepID=Q0RID3_FRAAA|nr:MULTISPECIES: LLM class flavin-dependent oxidoreductase [Frankia]CAJ62737.1 putative FMN-dependent alkanal monooxygenase [Frankia alni ACN14a]
MVEPSFVSVHDTVPVWRSGTAADALRDTVDLARAVEALGYRRYWVAEHHSTPALATSAPAVLAGQILAATGTIRVGSGAVLLPNHAPYDVAEQFGVLGSLHPGRVDLGIGRAVGGSAAVGARLGDPRPRGFPAQLDELVGYFHRAGGPVQARAVPEPAVPPEFWLVGSSPSSAAFAGARGLPYVFAHTIVPGLAPVALDAYRKAFRPSVHLEHPRGAVSAIVVLADSDDRAHSLADAFVLGQIILRTTDPDTLLPTEEETRRHHFSSAEESFRRERIDPQLVGSLATVAPRFEALVRESGADEFFALSQIPGLEQRIRSYELLAKAAAAL